MRCLSNVCHGQMPSWPVTPGRSDGLALLVGHGVNWHAPGWPTFERDQPHAFATREIVSAPTSGDLTLAAGQAPWQAMRGVSLAMLADAALMAGCAAFEVRYLVTPSAVGSSRVQMFLTAKARNWRPAVAQAAVALACTKLPDGFGWATPEQTMGFGSEPPTDHVVVELRRDEEVSFPQWDYIPTEYYYSVLDDPGDGSGWPTFWHTLNEVADIATVSVLFEQTDLDPQERHTLGSIATDLRLFSEPRTDYDFLGNPITYPACANARLALDSWERRLAQLRRPLLARLAVRAPISTAVTLATSLATAVATASGVTGTHPMQYESPGSAADIRQANYSFDWLEILPWGGHGIWTDRSAPNSLRRIPYLFGINEAATLLVLPVPDGQGVAAMPRARRSSYVREDPTGETEPVDKAIRLGVSMHHGEQGKPALLPLSAVNRHVLVVGSPGSGKTTTLLTMLVRLWRNHRIPFLVVESVKTEYRTLLGLPGMEELQIFTLGNESVAPLRLNPLEPPKGVRCEMHQSVVMALLKLALPLVPPQPQILLKALARTYERAGWTDDTTSTDSIQAPTLRDLLVNYSAVFAEIGYAGEAKNIGLAFQVRLESLLQGSRGKLLDTVQSSDFENLAEKPVVLELNEILDPDEKAVLAAFLLDRVRAGAMKRGSSGGELRHVTVIEEAHRLLSKADQGSGDPSSGDQARSAAVRSFCEAIAEMRSFGEGFVLSSQSPSALADAAIANAGSRILHRMESASDRSIMLEDLDAAREVREATAHLQRGEAAARHPEKEEAFLLAVEPEADVYSARMVSDSEVAEHMARHRQDIIHLLPYRLCSPDVCTEGCQAETRRRGRELGQRVTKQAAEIWRAASEGGVDAVSTIADTLAEGASKDVQVGYCGAVHLSTEDVAFRVRPGVDDRASLIEAIRRAARGA